MSAAPIVPPFLDEAADVVILSEPTRQIHVVPNQVSESLRASSSESSPWVGSASRRCFDCGVAALGLLVAAPMMVLTAILVRATSPGPVLFRQMRAGRYRRAFTL